MYTSPRFFRKLDGFDISSAGIELDATAPVVTDLYSSKVTSPWGGIYTVGEEVRVRVGESSWVLEVPTLEFQERKPAQHFT